jgi:hypothetical protein
LDLKAPLASPALTGTPTAPTATAGTNTTQVATTAFVQTAVSSLVDAAPATLDTLNELAAALGDDPNFATTVSTQIGAKLDASAYTAADVLTKIKTVDGSTSGLDADLLDGQHASAFATASHTHSAGDIVSGVLSADRLNRPSAGNWWNNGFVQVMTDGVVEVGKYFDFHATSAATADFDYRLTAVVGGLTGSGSFSAPMFYDSNDTAYYVDPASTSNLEGLTVANTISGSVTGNAGTATKLATARTISLAGDVTGSTSFDGSGNVSITATVADDSHNHVISNVDGLQSALDGKAPLTGGGTSGTWGISVTGSSGSISGFNNPTTSPTENTIVYRTSLGDIAAREITLSSNISSTTPTVLVSMFPTTNQLVRTTPAAVSAAIQSAASGTWGINITGNAGTVTNGVYTTGDQTITGTKIFENATPSSGTTARHLELYSPQGGGVDEVSLMFHQGGRWYHQIRSNGNGFAFTQGNNSNRVALIGAGIYGDAFYDNNNTGYYVDPASTGDSLHCAGNISVQTLVGKIGFATNDAFTAYGSYSAAHYGLSYNGTANPVSLSGYYGVGVFSQGNERFRVGQAGDVTAFVDFRTPIFYDNNDTGYYVDPNGMSNLYGFNATGKRPTAAPFCTILDTHNAAVDGSKDYTVLSVRAEQGNHSWGITQELRVNATSGDSPSLLFSKGGTSNTWSIGYGFNDTDVFRIKRDHGYINQDWGTTLMSMDRSGNVTFAGNVTAYSDERLKENIKTLENAVAIVNKMRGVRFNWKETGEEAIGVIAQEIEAVEEVSCLVSETPEDGSSSFRQKNVAYGNMVGLLIEAIKEQQAHIETLQQRIEHLEDINKGI